MGKKKPGPGSHLHSLVRPYAVYSYVVENNIKPLLASIAKLAIEKSTGKRLYVHPAYGIIDAEYPDWVPEYWGGKDSRPEGVKRRNEEFKKIMETKCKGFTKIYKITKKKFGIVYTIPVTGGAYCAFKYAKKTPAKE